MKKTVLIIVLAALVLIVVFLPSIKAKREEVFQEEEA